MTGLSELVGTGSQEAVARVCPTQGSAWTSGGGQVETRGLSDMEVGWGAAGRAPL